jgi:hypothetical protein
MGLILAINPGGSHSSTLSRLARALKGHELVGADSYAIAVKAIAQRKPDLVLLPSMSAKGEAELLARLRALPGGVPAFRLPPVTKVDFQALADDVRMLLEGPPGPSPHVIAAANAIIKWIHARRASWASWRSHT